MNTLFIGSTSGTACQLHYFTNLVRLGHAVIPYDPKYFEASNFFGQLEVKFRRGPGPAKIQSVHDDLVSLAKNNFFDLVFVMAENFVGSSTIEEMRAVAKRPPKFFYHSHDNVFSPGICKPVDFEKTLCTYDFVFTTKSQNVDRYQKLGQPNAYFIPSAYEPAVHRPVPPTESTFQDGAFDVSFIGTYDRSRDATINAVGWERLHIWGDHWKRFPDYAAHHTRITARAIYAFEFADVISHTRCSLGLLREEANDLHTQRTFEIPACGSLQIAPRNDEILSFFEEKKEIVCYESVEELKEKVDFYLKKDSERKKIAAKGLEKVTKGKHTYFDRVETMVDICLGQRRAARSGKKLSRSR